MSLHKAILSGKEHRVEYGKKKGTYAKSVDPMCRNHGGCSWCEGNRRYQEKKSEEKCKEELTRWRKSNTI